jgi:hypothetical protein
LKNDPKQVNVFDDYIPYKITSEDGIKLFVSYHNKNHDYKKFDRKIINPDIIRFQDNEVLDILEYDIIEIEKYLKRAGEKLDYPNDIHFVKPFDFYTNYPIILHGSKDTQRYIGKTLEAFKTIFTIQNQTLNKTISFTIGWEMGGFEVRLSVFGKSSEIVKWLNINTNIPIEYEKFREWLILQKDWIYNNYNYIENNFTNMLRDDGIFYIKRIAIDNEMISFPNSEEKNYFEFNISKDSILNRLVEEKSIFSSYLGLIKKATCTKTGEDYFTSGTSKYLDEDVTMSIEKIELLGFFWTDELDKKNITTQ